ncbi:SDR family NAD(P)-dependent oxidoreductase [Deinococcus oregonensis]|uniref:SDR family NAD(P)-dependent oxidoreductase n=1 Tax=Deinococcus oregonensis TaxID=1805970 RepID=A0ABV6AWL1_9DEIO
MSLPFNATSTTDDVLAGRDLRGQRILVTGVSSGLGIETARALVSQGAHVTGTARDLTKAAGTTAPIRAAAAPSDGIFDLVELNLASLVSVRRCASRLLEHSQPFDVVITNAGIMATPFALTEDGFESQLATNHLGHFVLVNRLVPLLRPGARIVSLASLGHQYADVNLEDPNFERSPYDPFIAYARSKTANILFAVEFDRRHRQRGVRATAVHPGAINTPLGRHLPDQSFMGMVAQVNEALAAQGKPLFTPKTIPQGAATSVWAAVVASADEVGGQYCLDCHAVTRTTDDYLDPTTEAVRPYALDGARAAALWTQTERWVGEQF